MRILVDMDDVLANFEEGFLSRWRKKHPKLEFIPLDERNTGYILDQYPKIYHQLIKETIRAPGFIKNLKPIDGAINALCEMDDLEYEVFICTTSMINYDICIPEKMEWVNTYLGKEWLEKLIILRDKTLVSANYLIDDNPKIMGRKEPEWEHVLYTQPYNMDVRDKKRLTWNDWKEVLEL
jgi:5'-nucleotidase